MTERTAEEHIDSLFAGFRSAARNQLVVESLGVDLDTTGKNEAEKSQTEEGFWREQPIPFADFVSSRDHMGQPPLSERQQRDIEDFLGTDPKRLFLQPENGYRVGVLLWGKGGGKDWVVSMIEAWIVYILDCMKDPRLALGMPVGEPIDIINVAFSADQARDVFFTKFMGRLKNWKWLWRRYLIMESGRTLNQSQHPTIKSNDDERVVHLKASEVNFPHGITAHSAHSENEAYEGKSPIFWVMDEAAAFRDKGKKANGKAVYDTLKSSAVSRFPNQWRGLAISYPRSKIDFMMQLYDEAADEPTMYRSRAATWEVNPTITRDNLNDEYRRDPKDARAKYECKPPGSEFGFFDEDMVSDIFLTNMPSTVYTTPVLIQGWVTNPKTGLRSPRQFVGKTLDAVAELDLKDRGSPRVIHVDGGLSGDNAGMIIGHGIKHIVTQQNPDSGKVYEYVVKKLVVDAMLIWRPDRERGYHISINNIASIVEGLRLKGMRIMAVSYDQWNSASSIEALTMAGIYCDMHNINTEDYTNLRNFINLGAVEVPCDQWSEWHLLQNELEQLEGIERSGKIKVDHPMGGSKELADCLSGCLRLLNDPEVRDHTRKRRAPRIQTVATERPATAGSPYQGTQSMRNPLQIGRTAGSVVGASIRQSQAMANIGRIVQGEGDDELPYTNKEGKSFKPPRPRSMRR